jgi:hypothetical protein
MVAVDCTSVVHTLAYKLPPHKYYNIMDTQ